MLERPGIMQHKKCEQFPSPVSGDGRPKKHFQNTHSMQTAVPRSKHSQYEEVGEFHLYRTAYRKFTCWQHKLLQNTQNQCTTPNSCFTPAGRLVEDHEYMKGMEVQIKDISDIFQSIVLQQIRNQHRTAYCHICYLWPLQRQYLLSSQPNHLMNAFCHQAKPIHAVSTNPQLILLSCYFYVQCLCTAIQNW